MTPAEIRDRIEQQFPGAVLHFEAEAIDPWILVETSKIAEICRFLRDDPELRFQWMMCLSGVDWPDRKVLQVVYHLHSHTHGHKIVLKVETPREEPRVPSVASVYRFAEWHEREAYDLFGIVFEGHPDLRRILLPFDWEGHPLRKDYVYPETYRGITNKP
jgi:NADH-quinone oxidoreductase subunit C